MFGSLFLFSQSFMACPIFTREFTLNLDCFILVQFASMTAHDLNHMIMSAFYSGECLL